MAKNSRVLSESVQKGRVKPKSRQIVSSFKREAKRNSELRMFCGSFNRGHNLKCSPVLLVEIRRATEIGLDQ